MSKMYLTNTLTKSKEEFKPIKEGEVGIYSCGPTVYWNQHIGHMFAYVQWDTLVRFLRSLGYKVTWVMNITDVGHMTSDEDIGEDKMEKGAKREGVSVWDLADIYIDQFTQSMDLLNITTPDVMPRATKHIDDQIALIKKIEKNGYTYKTSMGVVFDTKKYGQYAKFAGLDLESQKSRDDVETDEKKKNPWDFLLWVIGNPKHIMKWESPWGEGYPGWHIECTAMSTKYLGDSFDIHTGGIEHINVHHTNEIAQGYAAFGTKTANYWLHNAWLKGKKGEKMSKSLGNYLTAQELKEKGYNPLALRYLILSSHYRKGLSFSFEALDSASVALNNLYKMASQCKADKSRSSLSREKDEKINNFRNDFTSALSDDLNTPKALSVLWEMLKSSIPSEDKYDMAIAFDEILGFKIAENVVDMSIEVPDEVTKLVDEREKLRGQGEYEKADDIRKKIEDMGYSIEDVKGDVRIVKK